jgi:phospholipid-binding lipoprotein MlaA
MEQAMKALRGVKQSAAGYLAVIAVAFAAPASAQPASVAEAPGVDAANLNDPYESFNRTVFRINSAIDSATLKPLAKGYRAIAPGFFRKGLTNVLQNLEEPFTMGNSLLQGDFSNLLNSLGRLLINTTVGLGGVMDVASDWDVKKQDEDFGQTLAVWGVPEGPFLMLPFFGPSNPRDAVGVGVRFFADPASYGASKLPGNTADWALRGTELLDARQRVLDTFDKLVETSADPYAATRSAYRQQREFLISNGVVRITPAQDDPFDQPDQP